MEDISDFNDEMLTKEMNICIKQLNVFETNIEEYYKERKPKHDIYFNDIKEYKLIPICTMFEKDFKIMDVNIYKNINIEFFNKDNTNDRIIFPFKNNNNKVGLIQRNTTKYLVVILDENKVYLSKYTHPIAYFKKYIIL